VPRKVFVAGEILTAADVNTNLMDQAVMTFADAAARTAALGSPSEGMVTYLANTDSLELYTTVWGPVASGFDASVTITASNATWTVPSLGSPVVKVTVIGGGGGGGGNFSGGTNGSTGGTTTFNAAAAGTVTATGGNGGRQGGANQDGLAGSLGNGSSNGGQGGVWANNSQTGTEGNGGLTTISYLDLTGITAANVTIGAGGAGGAGSTQGGAGGRGEVIVEYVAGA